MNLPMDYSGLILAGFHGHGFVVEFERLVRAEVELVFPAEFEARQYRRP